MCKEYEAEECSPQTVTKCKKCTKVARDVCESRTVEKCDHVPKEVCEDEVKDVKTYQTHPVCNKVGGILNQTSTKAICLT